MQFAKTLLVAALAAVTSAQLQFTSFPPSTVTAGQGTYSLNYMTAQGKVDQPVTIQLRPGPKDNLGPAVKTYQATGGVFVFKPQSGLTTGDYALTIAQGGAPNYSNLFHVVGTSSSSSSSSSASSASSSSASSTLAPYPASSGNATMGAAGASGTGAAATGTGAVGSAGTGSPSIMRNQTFSSATISPSSTGGSGSGSGSGSSATAAQSSVSTGGAVRMDSSVALVFGIIGAFAYLN